MAAMTASDLPVTPVIEARNLSYRYADGTEALASINFRIDVGECVGLIGPNGAGKSTLLLHLNGLLPEQFNGSAEGIYVAGNLLNAKSLSEVRRHVGLLFQDPNDQLFCPTVFEDVAFGPQQLNLSDDEVRTRVKDCLTQVGLIGYEDRAPHHLSAGEKRRVCLAGILACSPQILVLDEPTSDLDPRGRRELKHLLQHLPVTKIIATHDLEMVVELCPRVLLLADGKLVASGATINLLSDEKLMLEHGLEKPHILQHVHPHPLKVGGMVRT
jgi:cobalt transport protein ATP-binding subunit